MENFIQITVFCPSEPRVGALFTGMREFSVILPKKEYFYFIHPTGPYFLFNSTDDSLKAQSSVETKRKASQQQTELHEGTCSRKIYKL